MPRKSKVGGRRRRGGRKGMRRMRRFRPARGVPEWASVTESAALTNITGLPYNMNTMFGLNGTNLSQFINRAVPVAQAYQHYRIKRIRMEFKPQYDTFTPEIGAAGTGVLVPNLFYMIDKSGSIPTNITLEGLKQMGAKPRAFDEKPLTIGWKPSVLTADMTAGGAAFTVQPSQYKISPWLNTNANSVDIAASNPSTIDHLGVYWYVE